MTNSRSLHSKRLWILAVIPLIAFLISLSIGRYGLTLGDMAAIIFSPENVSEIKRNIFWQIRLPRTLFALLAGGALALSGAALQGLFRNPLVAPDVVGVSSGATLGASIAIVAFGASTLAVQGLAFLGGVLAVGTAFYLASLSRHGSIVTLVLAGIIVNALAQSFIMLIKYTADPVKQLPALEFWTMGSLNTISWPKVALFLPIFLVGSLGIWLLRWQINALSLGEEEAKALGISVKWLRRILILLATLLVSAVVSLTGIIAWVGLIAPHLGRMLVGPNHLKSIPASFLCGGVLLLVADTLARSLTPAEIPVSIITAFLGAPFLAYLLWKVGKSPWQ